MMKRVAALTMTLVAATALSGRAPAATEPANSGPGVGPTVEPGVGPGGEPGVGPAAGVEPAAAEPGPLPAEPLRPAPPLPPPLPPPPEPPRYGDRGTSELAIGLGYSSYAGFLGAAGFRHFVVDGLAPGVEATYVSGGSEGIAYGLALAALRLVLVRTSSFALVATGRAGRVFIADHPDGWAAGGSGGVIIMLSPGTALELGYEALRLLPASFCADLRRCVLHGPVFGLRLSF